MRLTIAAVGRLRAGPLAELYGDYAGRLLAGRLLGPLDLREVEARGARRGGDLMKAEAALLKAQIPEGARTIALDAGGRQLDSPGLAALLGRWRDEGCRAVAFLIGGAEGLDPALLREAAFSLSLGRVTWPHLLVRALLAEQLFRADCILSGHPYHRE